MKYLLIGLAILAGTLWGYILGTLSVSVQETKPLEEVHARYSSIRINKDGTYVGTLVSGGEVTGCIKNALCERDK